MLFHIPEFASHVWISGFDIGADNVDQILEAADRKFPNACIQLVDLSEVAGSRFLFLAVFNALKSFHSKQPISRSLSLEILLYISASRQISEAIRRVGIASDTKSIAALAVGASRDEVIAIGNFLEVTLGAKSLDALVDVWSTDRIERVRSNFDISSKELSATARRDEGAVKAIERLVIERSALLTIRK